jgi:osmotically inducible protein OsmC
MELLAAAHASCLCETVAYALERSGHQPGVLETTAEVELEPQEGITGIHLFVRGMLPGTSAEEFTAIVAWASDNCPISKAMTGTTLSISAEVN